MSSGSAAAGEAAGTRAFSRLLLAGLLAGLLPGCGPQPPAPLPEDSFAFGVFGDGPYHLWEEGRFHRVLDDAGQAEIQWLIHVGDILWYPCSDQTYVTRRAELDSVPYAVVYTPGDNEWTDCHEERPGGYDPLDRLAALRRTFFDQPGWSLGGRPMPVTSQARDPGFEEFVENARWKHAGYVFATVHVVGSSNAMDDFEGRTPANDAEVGRRTGAALAWLDSTFAVARRDSARGIVIALHAEMGLTPGTPRTGYEEILQRLGRLVEGFSGPVLLIHGDDHTQKIDHPLTGSDGRVLTSFTRLETFGSPDIGWIRVVVDTARGRFSFEPRLMRGWW